MIFRIILNGASTGGAPTAIAMDPSSCEVAEPIMWMGMEEETKSTVAQLIEVV